MLSLALVALLSGAPADAAELGGLVVVGPQPVELNLYRGSERVATARTDAFGRYVLRSPPGDYWLQINVEGREAAVERVLIRAGAWRRDFTLDPKPLNPGVAT